MVVGGMLFVFTLLIIACTACFVVLMKNKRNQSGNRPNDVDVRGNTFL